MFRCLKASALLGVSLAGALAPSLKADDLNHVGYTRLSTRAK
jgi:hypothetical protein